MGLPIQASENFRAVVGDVDGMLKLGRERSILGHRRPFIRQDAQVRPTQIYHGFDGKHHAFFNLHALTGIYVASLMRETYPLVRPLELIPEDRRVMLDGSRVRLELARGEAWRQLVPESVRRYITENALDRRFRAEFGLETLSLQAST